MEKLVIVDEQSLIQKIEVTVKKVLEESKKEDLSEKFIGTQDVCNMFSPKLSKTTLALWTSQGKLNSFVIGGRIVYKYSDVVDSVTKIKRYQRA